MNDTKIFAVTGNPILHSLSPDIFSFLFKKYAINACYGKLAVSNVSEAIFLFEELKLSGMNVTAPFKQDIITYLDGLGEAAERIKSVNTIIKKDNHLIGYNTDYIGVIESLKVKSIPLENQRCVVLGAGGAGRAAVFGLLKERAMVTVVNRTYQKAALVSRSFGCDVERIENLEHLLNNTKILISTLSSAKQFIQQKWLSPQHIIFDANYGHSTLSIMAKNRRCQLIRGEEWLLNQAVPAFNYFFPKGPKIDSSPYLKREIKKNLAFERGGRNLKNISLIGFMGSGKSQIGKALAKRIGFRFLDTDLLIIDKEKRSIPEIFEIDGEDAFRDIEKEIIKEQLPNSRRTIYSCGGGAILEDENRQLLRKHSLVIGLHSSLDTTLNRIAPGSRPLLAGRNPRQRAEEMLRMRLDFYIKTADLIISSEESVDKVVEKIYEEISKTFSN
jgi:shikimate dehydrogenase